MTADPNEPAADAGQVDPLAAEQEALRAIERERLRALLEADMAVAESLHADDYQLIPPTGQALSKREYLDAIASHQLYYQVLEFISPIATHVSDQMAAVRYQCQLEVHAASGAMVSGTFWHTDIYEKRDGHWQAVWSQATRIPPDA